MAGKKAYHHGNLREALLTAAQDLLLRVAPSELSLREVARAAGVSPAAPYHHFTTKTDLFVALAQKGYADLDASMAEAQAAAPTDAAAQLLAAGMGYVIFARRHPALYKLMMQREYVEVTGNDCLMEVSGRGYARLEATVTALFKERHLGKPVDADVQLCWAAVHGLAGFYADHTLQAWLPENQQLPHARAVLARLIHAFDAK